MTPMRVARRDSRPRLLLRQRVALLLHAMIVASLAIALLTIAPASHRHALGLIAVIGVLAVIADRSEVPLPTGVGFDSTIALVLLAVAVSGPLAALVVFVLPWLTNALTGRRAALR